MVRQKSKNKNDDDLFIIECIVDRRRMEGKVQYLVKWKDYPSSHNTWEDATNIAHCREILAEFKEHRIQEGFDDSDDDVPTVSPPQKKRKPRKRKAEDSGDQGNSISESSTSRRRSTPKNKNPRLVVDLSNATEIIAASYIESGKFFCVQFSDESKYWVSNEECRKHLPQMLLDFYENCSVFMESEPPVKEKQKRTPSKKKKTIIVEEKFQPAYSNDFQDRLDSSSSILDQYPEAENDETDLIIEEGTFEQEVSFSLSPGFSQSGRNLMESEFLESETAGLS
ncbi:hypothetical protein FO519_005194 [Halicephalobus sp. NKZ332]|nr:hypothetical protein FO519_005194 [Halicephalobus sp. NKZ332]